MFHSYVLPYKKRTLSLGIDRTTIALLFDVKARHSYRLVCNVMTFNLIVRFNLVFFSFNLVGFSGLMETTFFFCNFTYNFV